MKRVFGCTLWSFGLTVTLIALYALFRYSQSMWLTHLYGEEINDDLQSGLDLSMTLASERDPAVPPRMATGVYLDRLLRGQCKNCPKVPVGTDLEVVQIKVLEYAEPTAVVEASVEYGWQNVIVATGAKDGACHAQSYTTVLKMQREQGVWNISDVLDRSREDEPGTFDTRKLLQKYCPSATP